MTEPIWIREEKLWVNVGLETFLFVYFLILELKNETDEIEILPVSYFYTSMYVYICINISAYRVERRKREG